MTVPLPTDGGPARTMRTARSGSAGDLGVLEETLSLVAAEAAEPTALRDVELVHDAARLHLADSGEGLEHAHDLELRERVVARALVEQLFEADRTCLQLRLHLGALPPSFGRLRECGLTLLGGERRG